MLFKTTRHVTCWWGCVNQLNHQKLRKTKVCASHLAAHAHTRPQTAAHSTASPFAHPVSLSATRGGSWGGGVGGVREGVRERRAQTRRRRGAPARSELHLLDVLLLLVTAAASHRTADRDCSHSVNFLLLIIFISSSTSSSSGTGSCVKEVQSGRSWIIVVTARLSFSALIVVFLAS